MRTSVGVGLVAVCLGLAGCSLFHRKQGSAGSEQPFVGTTPHTESSGTLTASTSDPSLPPDVNGLLAGQVLDRFNHRPGKVFIQVVDLEENRQPAPKPLEVEDTTQGYFTIKGLKPGHPYQLIARVREGDRVLSGTTVTRPPNPRLLISVSEDYTSPSTPPIPSPPAIPGQSPLPRGTKPPGGPAAALDPPVRAPGNPTTNGMGGPAPSSGAAPPSGTAPPSVTTVPVDPERVATDAGPVKDGFYQAPINQAPIISVPPQPVPPVPLPTREEPVLPPVAPPMQPSPPPQGSVSRVPVVPTPVPSCQLVGNRLYNFALRDLDGQEWEFRRQRTGRLVLLDFWYSTCGPCLEAVPHLVKLQGGYGPYGLQVVGIAYERGEFAAQVQKVRQVRGRYSITYPTLLGGGGNGPCPVRQQFQIQGFPTLVLIDETGLVVWRREGLDVDGLTDLENEIRYRLGVRR